MRSIFGIIGRSPFGPLVRHTEMVHECVVLIRPLVDAFVGGEWDRTQELYEQISKLEHKADVLKHEIRDHLPRSVFLPVDRGDLLLFLNQQDGIADRAEDLGVLLTTRRTPTPEALRAPVHALVEQVIRTSESWYQAATELTLLQEASFGGAQADKVLQLVERVGQEEWEADKLQAHATKALFAHEEELGPVSVLLWMHFVEVLGDIANHAESTADLLRLMMARS